MFLLFFSFDDLKIYIFFMQKIIGLAECDVIWTVIVIVLTDYAPCVNDEHDFARGPQQKITCGSRSRRLAIGN